MSFCFAVLLQSSFEGWASPRCHGHENVSLETLAGTSQAILVGERHGTKEMPDAFYDIARTLVREDRNIIIALEYKALDQPLIDRVMAAESAEDSRLIFAEFKTRDGRTSAAMRALLSKLWQLKREGAAIIVVGVDYWSVDYPEDDEALPDWVPEGVERQNTLRDVRMGQNAVDACRAANCDLLLFYAGNAHTRTTVSQSATLDVRTGEVSTFDIVPAGRVIAEHMLTSAIFLSHRGGVSQSIQNQGYKAWSVEANTPDYVAEDGVIYCHQGSEAHHSHIMSVGTITASIDPYDD